MTAAFAAAFGVSPAMAASQPDLDGDGISNLVDPDVDGDGILNGDDRNVDGGVCKSGPFKGKYVGDRLKNDDPNEKDIDADTLNDDSNAERDIDGDGLKDNGGREKDIDGDGRRDDADAEVDIDGDGTVNGEDDDMDGDGISNFDDQDPAGTNCTSDAPLPIKPAVVGESSALYIGLTAAGIAIAAPAAYFFARSRRRK